MNVVFPWFSYDMRNKEPAKILYACSRACFHSMYNLDSVKCLMCRGGSNYNNWLYEHLASGAFCNLHMLATYRGSILAHYFPRPCALCTNARLSLCVYVLAGRRSADSVGVRVLCEERRETDYRGHDGPV